MEDLIRSVAIGVVVALVLGLMTRSAQGAPSEDSRSRDIVAYPRGTRIVILVLGVVIMGMIVLFFVKGRGQSIGLLIALSLFFLALILVLHAEAFLVRITWDEENIYTRSPWRKRREIPLSDVISCDYSHLSQWYRVKTQRHGTIRLSIYLQGIEHFLDSLPCDRPAYPPAS